MGKTKSALCGALYSITAGLHGVYGEVSVWGGQTLTTRRTVWIGPCLCAQVVRDLKARLAAGDEGVSQQLVDEAVQELIRLKQSFRFRI